MFLGMVFLDPRSRSGEEWMQDINLKELVRELQASLSSDDRAMQCFPSYFHVAAWLATSGFSVEPTGEVSICEELLLCDNQELQDKIGR